MAARHATRATGKSILDTSDPGPLAIAGGAGVVLLLVVFFVIAPMFGDNRQQAEAAARQAWRVKMDSVCLSPTMNEAPLPAVAKGSTISDEARLQYIDRAQDLGALSRHISCATQFNTERMCATAARSEFLDHVKRFFGLRADILTKTAAALGTTSATLEKQVGQYLNSKQVKQITAKLGDQDRELFERATTIFDGDTTLIRGIGALIEDGYLPLAELIRTVGPLPTALAPLAKAQAARKSCQ